MSHYIETVEALREIIPSPIAALERKKIGQLGTHGARLIELSRLVALAYFDDTGSIDIALRAGAHFRALDARRVLVSDDPAAGVGRVTDGGPLGAIFAIPGVRETLRVNGCARRTSDGTVLELDESYLHCPKAFIRSELWESTDTDAAAVGEEAGTELGEQSRRFLARSPFAFLGSGSPTNGLDASPRGDPAGFVYALDERTLLLPERPGNRLIDSLRNLLEQPSIALLCLVPGSDALLRLRGRARPTADPALLQPLAVQGKPPVVAIEIALEHVHLQPCPALAKSGVWDSATYVDRNTLPNFGRMIIDQLEPDGRLKGLKSLALERILKHDEKKRLY